MYIVSLKKNEKDKICDGSVFLCKFNNKECSEKCNSMYNFIQLFDYTS